MKPFELSATCPKCKSGQCTRKYNSAALGGIDSLSMRCLTCGHGWITATADADAKRKPDHSPRWINDLVSACTAAKDILDHPDQQSQGAWEIIGLLEKVLAPIETHTEEWGTMESVLDLATFHDNTWRDQPEVYWLSRLMEEVGELAMALNDRHERDLPPDPDLELREIASICVNWLEMRKQANDDLA